MAKIKNRVVGEHKKFESLPLANNQLILSEAKTDGVTGRKVSNDNLPTVIIEEGQRFHEWKNRAYIQAQFYFNECNSKIIQHNANHNIDTLRTTLHSTTDHSDSLDLPKEKAFLEEGFQTFESHRENYNRFKKFHSLQELPKNADPAETKFQFFALFLLLIIEIIVNGMLLSGGGESTIGQSASVATIQSIINVIGCYFVGKILWGNIKYAESIANKIGLISLFSGIFYFIILLNINMGLFREHIVKTGQDQYGAVSLEVGAGLWQWMPFPLELSPQSQMAVAVGMVFAFLAFLDGMKSDDLYPGYGDVYRGALKHKKKIGNKIRSINLAWNDALKKFNIKQSTSGEKGTQSIKEWSDETNTIEQVWVDYKNNLEALEAIYDKAIKLYVTNYNKFHNESSLRLQADLFTKNELDLKVQFSDIAQYYLDDNSREKEEANRKKIFAKEFSELKKELASINEKITTEIKLLSEKYACKLN